MGIGIRLCLLNSGGAEQVQLRQRDGRGEVGGGGVHPAGEAGGGAGHELTVAGIDVGGGEVEVAQPPVQIGNPHEGMVFRQQQVVIEAELALFTGFKLAGDPQVDFVAALKAPVGLPAVHQHALQVDATGEVALGKGLGPLTVVVEQRALPAEQVRRRVEHHAIQMNAGVV